MTLSMYQASVPVFSFMLTNLAHVLAKSEKWASERRIDPAVLLSARLAPDMLPLTRQVFIATDHARNAPSRLAGRDLVSQPDVETTFEEIAVRIAAVKAHLAGFSAADIDGSEDRMLDLKVGGQSMTMRGQDYLLNFALPNFYFHVTTAYAILRHNGAPLGKGDFFGRG